MIRTPTCTPARRSSRCRPRRWSTPASPPSQTRLAVAAASHSGESVHLEAVRRILANVGLDEHALGNTPALPLAPAVAAEVLRARRRPEARCCRTAAASTTVLATSVVNGWDVDSYLDVDRRS